MRYNKTEWRLRRKRLKIRNHIKTSLIAVLLTYFSVATISLSANVLLEKHIEGYAKDTETLVKKYGETDTKIKELDGHFGLSGSPTQNSLVNKSDDLVRKSGGGANLGTRFIAKSGDELKAFLKGITDLPVGVPYSGKYRYIGSQYADETVTVIHNGITDVGNRFRKGLYLSETKSGNIIEVGAYGGSNGKKLFEITDFQVDNLLDVTDPITVEILGTTFEQMKKIHPNDLIQYEFTQEIAIWAKNNGYSGIKFYGSHGTTDYVNLLIFEQSTVNSAIKGSINPKPW